MTEGETDFKLSPDVHTPTLCVHIWTYIKIKKSRIPYNCNKHRMLVTFSPVLKIDMVTICRLLRCRTSDYIPSTVPLFLNFETSFTKALKSLCSISRCPMDSSANYWPTALDLLVVFMLLKSQTHSLFWVFI